MCTPAGRDEGELPYTQKTGHSWWAGGHHRLEPSPALCKGSQEPALCLVRTWEDVEVKDAAPRGSQKSGAGAPIQRTDKTPDTTTVNHNATPESHEQMLANSTVVITLQYINVSDQHGYLKCTCFMSNICQ